MSYNPNHPTKRQRHMKKYIPYGIYCHSNDESPDCPFWHSFWTEHNKDKVYTHKRSECQFGDSCPEDCFTCLEEVTFCEFLNYIEYGPFPLGDMCKVCGIHEKE